jgi:hypothetical protein
MSPVSGFAPDLILARLVVRTTPSKKFRNYGPCLKCTAEYRRGSRFLTWGHRLFADPLQSSTHLVRSSAAPHQLHHLRIVPSGLNEPQSPPFCAKRGSATSPALKVGRS